MNTYKYAVNTRKFKIEKDEYPKIVSEYGDETGFDLVQDIEYSHRNGIDFGDDEFDNIEDAIAEAITIPSVEVKRNGDVIITTSEVFRYVYPEDDPEDLLEYDIAENDGIICCYTPKIVV